MDAERTPLARALGVGRNALELLRRRLAVVGLDASTGDYTDLVKAGIIDPVKVVRTALSNAASIAGLLLTTESVISDKPEKKKAPSMPQGMDDMDF